MHDSIHKRIWQAAFRGIWFLYPLLRLYWRLVRPRTSGVKVFVRYGDEVLLVRQGYGYDLWTLPGGGRKRAESIENAAAREVLEEVGVQLRDIRLLGLFLSTGEYKRDQIWVAEGKAENHGFTVDGSEIIEARWFPLRALPENRAPIMREFLRFYQEAEFSDSN